MKKHDIWLILLITVVALGATAVHGPTTYRGSITPGTDSTFNIGSSSKYWGTTFTDDIYVKGPWIDVRAYGAVAGSTTANNAGIAAAITAAGTTGGVIFFPTGNYPISTVISITEGNIVLAGPWAGYAQGTGGAYITCNNTDGEACVQIGESDSIVKDSGVENLRVVAGTNTSGVGIRVYHAHNVLLRKVRVQGFTGGHGIRLEGKGTVGTDSVINTSIDRAYLTNNLVNLYLKTGDSSEATSADEGYFEDIRIGMNSLENAVGVRLENAKNNSFSNLQINNPTTVTSGQVGIHFSDSSGSALDENAAGGNTIFGLKTENLTTGIQFDGNTAGNAIYGYNAHGNTTLVDDSSGGGNIVLGVTGSLNTNTPDMYFWHQTFENFLPNPDFSIWASGTSTTPTHWSKPAAGTVSQNTSETIWGKATVQIVATDTNTSIYYEPSDDGPYEDKYITFGAWVKTETANAARLRVNSGATGGSTYSDYHTGGGDYEYLVVRSKPASATTLMLFQVLADVASTVYVDAVRASIGYEAPIYSEPSDYPIKDYLVADPQSSEAITTEGAVAYADGSSWGTSLGKGLRQYDGANWQKLATITAEQTFGNGDTSPSISAGNMFVAAATPNGATIVDLDDGVAGQTVIVRAVDDTTDFTDGGNLKLAGNWTPDGDDVLELYTPDGTTWYEISRSAN